MLFRSAKLRKAKSGGGESWAPYQICTFRMKGDTKEYGDLVSLYRKLASFYFADADDKKSLMMDDGQRAKVWKTMASLEGALKVWGLDVASISK